MMEKEKADQVASILRENDIDLWLLIDRESGTMSDPMMDLVVGSSVTWLSFFMFFADGTKYALVGNLDIEKIGSLGIFDEVTAYTAEADRSLLELLERHKPASIAVNYSIDSAMADGLTHGRYLALQKILQGTPHLEKLQSAEKIISALRGRKSAAEISRIRQAARITQDIFNRLTEFVRPGMSEQDLAAFIKAERVKAGLDPAWEEDSCPAVFTGPQTIGAHSGPTGKIIEPGHVFNVDFGVRYHKYCSDMQRTWYLLRDDEKEAPEKVRQAFATLVRVVDCCAAAMKPGVSGLEIDTLARTLLSQAGYEEYPHALGHQIGRAAHDGGGLLAPEWPRYGQLPFMPLEEGQVFTIEPRIYIPPHGVATIEEIVLVGAEGAEFISPRQTELYTVRGNGKM